MSFFCTHFWLSYIYISRESSLVINRDTISNDAISTLRVVRASISLAGLSVEKFYRLATGRTEGLAFPTRACFSVGVVQAWLDNDTRISLDRVSKLEETWYLKESSGFQLFLPPFLSLLQRYQPSLREFKCNVHGSLHVTERESRWREGSEYVYIYKRCAYYDFYRSLRSRSLERAIKRIPNCTSNWTHAWYRNSVLLNAFPASWEPSPIYPARSCAPEIYCYF